jgi:hypothetical protein
MKTLIFTLLTLLSIPDYSAAEEDPRYASIRSLGELNGIALYCKYLDQVRRMKAAIIETAPKERTFGLAFDIASNDSYLAIISKRSSCPGPAGFAEQVDERINMMKASFGVDSVDTES